MSSARVYVGNLDPTVQKEELTDTFKGRISERESLLNFVLNKVSVYTKIKLLLFLHNFIY
jgi:RNA recognition motif-containing protein